MDAKLYNSLGRLAAICETVTPGLDVHRVVQSPGAYLAPAVGALADKPQSERAGALLKTIGTLPTAALTTTDGAYFFYSGYYSEKHGAKSHT